VIALVLTLFAFGLAYWQESKRHGKEFLTRLKAETVLQKHRGSLENCIKHVEWVFYLDFVFTNEGSLGLSVDVYSGEMTGRSEFELIHPRNMLPGEFERFPGLQKLSTTFPDVNRCIIDVIDGDVRNLAIGDSERLIHRYVTDYGTRLVRGLEERRPQIEIDTRSDWEQPDTKSRQQIE
jgi:hypothetical protein